MEGKSLRGTSAARIPVGVKLGRAFLRGAYREKVEELTQFFDFIEFQSPTASLPQILRAYGIDPQKLRPHGSQLSLSDPRPIPRAMLEAMKEDCFRTSSPYVVEHLGCLNPDLRGPGLGYIFPPVLNEESAQIIARKAAQIQNHIGLPIALENPVFYTVPHGSTMNFPTFVAFLSSLLPTGAGWLIDWSHLVASSRNLGLSISSMLESYRLSGRAVYELHVANIFQDGQGAWHDDHRHFPEVEKLQSELLLLASFVPYRSVTLETVLEENLDIQGAIALSHCLREISPVTDWPNSPPAYSTFLEAPPSPPPAVVLEEREASGRLRIFTEYLYTQFLGESVAAFEAVAAAAGFARVTDLTADFLNFLANDHSYTQLPLYDICENDYLDLRVPFLTYVQQLSKNGRLVKPSWIHRLTLAAACLHARYQANLGNEREPIVVSVGADGPKLPSGRYAIEVNQVNQITARRIGNASPGHALQIGSRTYFEAS